MSLLIISLPPEGAGPTPLFDYVLSPDGSSVGEHACVPLALLPASAPHDVVLVVPAHALSWHQVTLPPGSLPRSLGGERSTTRLRAILDGLLEDQLLDEPAQLHLALQPQPTVGVPLWVAACSREWLKSGLQTLVQAGHPVSRIVPELSVQALQEAIFVTEQAGAAQLAGWLHASAAANPRGGGALVCALGVDACALLDARPEAGAPAAAGSPALTPVLAEPAVAAQAEQAFGRSVAILQRPARMLQAALGPWDLAQFELTQLRRNPRFAALTQGLRGFLQAPTWRPARWALLAVLAVNLLGINAWALRVKSNLQAQRQAIRTVLTETFPKIPVVVDAPVQMAREVALLQRSRGRSAAADLEGVLATFSALAPAEYVLTAIEFGPSELRLSGPAMSAAVQGPLQGALQSRGLRVSIAGNDWLISPGERP